MKKYILIAAVLSLAAAASCSKQDSVSPSTSGNGVINFSSYSGRAVTKAATTDAFTVAASYNGNSYFTSTAVTWDETNSVWNTDGTTYFWPVDVSGTKPMIFYGAMPSTLSAGASVSASSLAADSDIRTAYTKCTSVPDDGKVALAFSHQMAKVSFKLVGGDADLVYKVTAFSISAKNNGSVAPETGTWTPSGEATTYNITGFPASVSGTTASSEFGSTNLVPDQSATVSVTYSVETAGAVLVSASATKTATLALTGKHGTQTLYTLTLPSGASELKLSSEVTAWNSENVEQGWDPEFTGVTQTFEAMTTELPYHLSGLLLLPGSSVTVDYGDNSATETFTNTSQTDSLVRIPSHTYSAIGTYTVQYTISSGTAELLVAIGDAVSTTSDITLLSNENNMAYLVGKNDFNYAKIRYAYAQRQVYSLYNENYYVIVTFKSDSLLTDYYSPAHSWASLPKSVKSITNAISLQDVFYIHDDVTSVNSGAFYLSTGLGIQTSKGYWRYTNTGTTITLGNGTTTTLIYIPCVPAGTPILVSLDGDTKPVEDLKPGDDIVAWSEKESKNVLTDVKSLIVTQHKCKIVMTLSNGDVLTMSEGHPLLTENGWKAYNPNSTEATNTNVVTGNIAVGDKVFTYDGLFVEIVSLELIDEDITMYMPDVNDNYDTYYALGSNGTEILSHNY